MGKFYEDVGEILVGRCYKTKKDIRKITSVDICVGEIHYSLYSNDGAFIGKRCSSIESFSHLERASQKEIENIKSS